MNDIPILRIPWFYAVNTGLIPHTVCVLALDQRSWTCGPWTTTGLWPICNQATSGWLVCTHTALLAWASWAVAGPLARALQARALAAPLVQVLGASLVRVSRVLLASGEQRVLVHTCAVALPQDHPLFPSSPPATNLERLGNSALDYYVLYFC